MVLGWYRRTTADCLTERESIRYFVIRNNGGVRSKICDLENYF